MVETCPNCLGNGTCPRAFRRQGAYVNGRLNLDYGPPQGKKHGFI